MKLIMMSKMNCYFRVLFLTSLALFTFFPMAFCQQQAPAFDKLVDFLPPAPNASAITKYGEASVNKNTGTPNINIPLFTIKGTKLSTSINIGYSSNGIKVDEVASRVGMGWAINAGGVVTRTVRGVPDETNTRHYPYEIIGFNWSTYNYMKRVANSQQVNGYDAEPDLFNFSFDGYNGSFVSDGEGYIFVNKTGIKAETNFSYGAEWNIKITTPDGIKYIFGGPSATETTKREQACGKNYSTYVPTSWYLKEIQHLNGEKIIFSYTPLTYENDNGVSETMYDPGLSGIGSGCSCPGVYSNPCKNISKTNGVLLNTIEVTGKVLVNFSYTNREDCNDKLISSITYKDPVNIISSFTFDYNTVTSTPAYNNLVNFGYDKTPYLSSLTENSADNSFHKKHFFSYIEPEGRPSRLSYSQDHWGFFNGQVNTSFTPNLGGTYSQWFPNAKAIKKPEAGFTQKGLLRKIVYPTGGTTTIFYQPNVYNIENATYTTLHKLSCDVTGSGFKDQEIKTKIFYSELNQPVDLIIQCRDNSGNGDFDSIHNKGTVLLKDVTNNNAVIFSDMYLPGFSGTIHTFLPFPGHYYMLELKANGTVVTTKATLEYYPKNNPSAATTDLAGGMRVQKILTADAGGVPIIKRYYYGTLDNLNQSSLANIAQPRYIGGKTIPQPCALYGGTNYMCQYNTISSSSVFNLGYFNNNLVSYGSVIESIGDNFEGGGTETKFFVGKDALGVVMWNGDIINSSLTNFSSFYNGKPQRETVVKKMLDGSLKPIRKTEYTYLEEPAGTNSVYGYAIVAIVPDDVIAYDTTCTPVYDPVNPLSCYNNLTRSLGIYNMVRYDVFSSFMHPQSEIQTLWDENGENPVTTTNNSFYDNLQNFQLTRSEFTNSKGELLRSTNKYPHDYAGTQVYDEMIAKNIITPLLHANSDIINAPNSITQISEQHIDYSNAGNQNYLPVVMRKSVKGNGLEIEGTIDQYDDNGNILQFTNRGGIVTSIIWGYNYQYPVAQVVGVTYSNAVAQLSVSVANLQTMDGTILQTELNRIRTSIPAARVTSYTYKHLTGLKTISDANNKTNTYEYDSFNRLITIKDQDGNVVKKNEYSYANPDPNTGLPIYFNAPKSQYLACTSCVPGFISTVLTTVEYVVPAGRYYSLISQQDAEAQVDVDIATYGQEYVNKNSTCSNTAICTGSGYKFVSCGCELGKKVCEYSEPDGNGGWYSHFHLLWSDGSISPSFTEQISSCSGVDKKFLNCVCETATKVCDQVVPLGGNNYQVTYRYHWSDNSYSSPITETFNCSGPDKKLINCTCEVGSKVYSAAVFDRFGLYGCQGQWLCTFKYKWSDNSMSQDSYTECSATPCIILTAEFD